MELRHYAAAPTELDRAREYKQREGYKPRGFWVSVPGEDDWPQWCRGEGFGLDRLAVRHDVVLTPDSNVMLLDNPQTFLSFSQQFGLQYSFDNRFLDNTADAIDWPVVTSQYDGIVIAPYRWEFRLDMMWYYPWDCASGCIWNLDAIESVTAHTLDDVQSV